MISYVIGDATQPQGGDELKYLVHCCNDIGAWGSGFVLAVSAKWPEPEKRYNALKEYELGSVMFVPVDKDEDNVPSIVVCNLIGQHETIRERTEPIRYDAIWQGMTSVAIRARETNGSIHMPRMGADRARGRWPIIEAMVNEACGDVPVTVYDLADA